MFFRSIQMRGLLPLLLVAVIVVVGVRARGRVFQRFSPDILANLGYGGGPYREVGQTDLDAPPHLRVINVFSNGR